MILSFVYSWVTSVLLLVWPPQLIRFIFGTVRSVARAYATLATKFWWIVPIFLGVLAMTPGKPTKLLYSWLFVSYFSYICIWIFLSILASRPAAEAKGYSYFRHYIGYFFYFLIMGALLFLMIYYALLIPRSAKDYEGYVVASLVLSFFISWFFFACLFYLDSHKEPVRSTTRGLKMVLYNYPFCWVATTICYGLAYILYKIYIYVPARFSIFVSWALIKVFILVFFSFIFLTILFVPIVACIFSNFYNKRLQEQRTLYFAK